MPTMTHPAAQPHPQQPQPQPQLGPGPVVHEGRVTGGVDTHNDTHTAAVLDATGRLL